MKSLVEQLPFGCLKASPVDVRVRDHHIDRLGEEKNNAQKSIRVEKPRSKVVQPRSQISLCFERSWTRSKDIADEKYVYINAE